MPQNPAPEAQGQEKLPEDLKEVLGEGAAVHDEATSMIHANMGGAIKMAETTLGEDAKPELEAMKELADRASEARSAFETRAERLSSPYVVSPELQKTLRIATVLKKPLLLEGEPGTGKTSLAYALAGEEDLPLIHCRGKSTLTAQSVMYEIDYVARLNDATLTQAIPENMRAEAGKWESYLKAGNDPNSTEFQGFMRGLDNAARLLNLGRVSDVRNYISYGELGEAIIRGSRGEKVILLFDEVDKAKREFPNDLLDELEHMTMRIRETGEEVSSPRENIVVVITSNHERDLPEPFLRRCVYSYLEFPKPDQLTEIVKAHIPDVEEKLLRSAVTRFYEIRETQGLQKPPSTSEMLDWVKVLMEFGIEEVGGATPLPEAVLKIKEDMDLVRKREKETRTGVYEADDYDEFSVLEAYEMETAAIEALRGSRVVNFKGEEYYRDRPSSELLMALANGGVAFKYSERDREPFEILVDGVKMVAPMTFVFPHRLSAEELALSTDEILQRQQDKPEGERMGRRQIIQEKKASRLLAALEEGKLVAGEFVVTEQPVAFTGVETSNQYFVKGKDASGRTIFRTSDGKYIYEKSTSEVSSEPSDEDLLGSATLKKLSFDDEDEK